MVKSEHVSIEIDGEEAADLYSAINVVTVELDDEMAAMFRIELSMKLLADGTWTTVDDERFSPWREFKIHAGFDGGTEQLIRGYLTHVRPLFDNDIARCRIELWGMDATALMDREQKLRHWPDKKDSDIAQEIFGEYGLAVEAQDTTIVHDEKLSTILQRETDIQLLRRLAFRNGFECYVEDETGYFGPAGFDADPQPAVAIHFGPESNLGWFRVEVDALAETQIGMFQLDRVEKEVLTSQVATSLQPAFGAKSGIDLVPPGLSTPQAYVDLTGTTGLTEMDTLCQSVFERGAWFVTGEGLIAANRYGAVLRPRKPVLIKGIGETHSGNYYVTHVTHSITVDGYSQQFRVKRNGLTPIGDEQFAGPSGLGGL